MLELQSVACARGERRLFSDLTLTLAPGQLLRVTGANGSGKTSLLRMLCGLLAPAQGQVLWLGQSIEDARDEYHRQLVYLGHAAALKDELSALENLLTSCVLGGTQATVPQAMLALSQAGLRGREHLPARVLSQGQRRRAALARLVLVADAPLWVLDEPFNALDTAATQWLLDLVTQQLARLGMVVLTSHQPVALPEQVQQVALAL